MPALYGLPRGLRSMIEKQPQIRCVAHAAWNAATSGPSSVHMMAGFVSIDSPCNAYSGKTTRSIVGMPSRAFATIRQIFSVCRARSSGVATTGNWSCTSPITTPLGDLFRPPSPLTVVSSPPVFCTLPYGAAARLRRSDLPEIPRPSFGRSARAPPRDLLLCTWYGTWLAQRVEDGEEQRMARISEVPTDVPFFDRRKDGELGGKGYKGPYERW